MGAEAELNNFIRGSVGYMELVTGDVAKFGENETSEINAIIAVEDAVVEVLQYGPFTDGTVTLAADKARYGKFKQVTVTSGTVLIYADKAPKINV